MNFLNFHDARTGSYRDGGVEFIQASDDADAIKIAQAMFSRNGSSLGYQRRYSLRGQKGESLWAAEDPLKPSPCSHRMYDSLGNYYPFNDWCIRDE